MEQLYEKLLNNFYRKPISFLVEGNHLWPWWIFHSVVGSVG